MGLYLAPFWAPLFSKRPTRVTSSLSLIVRYPYDARYGLSTPALRVSAPTESVDVLGFYLLGGIERVGPVRRVELLSRFACKLQPFGCRCAGAACARGASFVRPY